MKFSLLVFLTILAVSYSAILPEGLKPCRTSNPNYRKCVASAYTNFLTAMGPGISKFKIPPIEPLELKNIKIGQNNGTISLQQVYHNVKLHGLTKGLRSTVERIDLDRLILVLRTFNTRIELIGGYEAKGKIMIVPIEGKGNINLTMDGMNAEHHIYFEKYNKNGETYMKIKKYDLKFQPEKFTMNLENLFANSNAELGKQLTDFLHENSDLIFGELKGDYEKIFSQLYERISNEVLSKFPASLLFPE